MKQSPSLLYSDFYPYPDENAFMTEMRKFYSNRSFRFGCGGFFPDVENKGKHEDDLMLTNPIYKIMFDLAADLNTKAEPIKQELHDVVP